MDPRNRLNPYPLHPIQIGLFILIELQLIFGKQFTTFHIAGPFYLSDLIFSILAIISLIAIVSKRKSVPISWPIFAMLIISFIYLIYSFVTEIGPANYIIRHYALFIYLGISFVIFYSFIDKEKQKFNVKFIILIGFLSLIGQIGMHFYNLFTVENYHLQLFSRFNYLTELIMPGLVILEAWVLVYVKDWRYKIIFVFGILFLSVTLGHASAFLACLTPIAVFLMFKLNIRPIIWVIVCITCLGALFFILPQFSDSNALWRVLYWREIIKDGIINYYGVIGHGFGGAFITESMNQAFLDELGSIHFDVNPEEKYLTPMHNSFVTFMFHIGIIPGLLIFLPLKNVALWTFSKMQNRDPDKQFLAMSLLGFMIWVSFNVILEMPHSSAFFWLVYFTTIYHFNSITDKRELTTEVKQ